MGSGDAMKKLIALVALLLAGCSSPFIPGDYTKRVVCYSGGEVIFQDDTTIDGITTYGSGSTYVFVSQYSGTQYRVPTASCIVSRT